mmetsp:Transcript_17368/g.21236  ORF Transcript_17368/g.21236 Transcript_17368/m.21236 type:complete len:294 (-) Transcript_17368:133-1014(-)
MESTISFITSKVQNINGLYGYIVIFLCIATGHTLMNRMAESQTQRKEQQAQAAQEDDDDEDEDPPRNFTFKQLKHFDGKKDESSGEDKPVYLSLNGIVFDVTEGKDFYGPGGPYELFAGHECGIALAKMSFETSYLDDVAGCQNLNFGEKDELENWIQKFQYYRCYPVKGRLLPDSDLPDPNHIIEKEELMKNNGQGEIPEKYATAPIYIGAGGKVYDVSFGGVTFYGEGCAYNGFAGRDASRALALMSLDPNDAKNSDISDLDEKNIKVLNDWIKTFEERKMYPVVGRLEGK